MTYAVALCSAAFKYLPCGHLHSNLDLLTGSNPSTVICCAIPPLERRTVAAIRQFCIVRVLAGGICIKAGVFDSLCLEGHTALGIAVLHGVLSFLLEEEGDTCRLWVD